MKEMSKIDKAYDDMDTDDNMAGTKKPSKQMSDLFDDLWDSGGD